MSAEASYRICLQQGGKRVVVDVAANETLADLYKRAADSFDATSDVSLRAGFPPQPLPNDVNIVARSKISPNERVSVTVVAAASASTKKRTKQVGAKSAKKAKTSESETPSKSATRRRSQRAAAKAATESFADTIKAQDAVMRQETSKKKKTNSPSSRSSPSASQRAAREQAARTARLNRLGGGRRLADGAAVGKPNSKARNSGPKFKSKDDVSFALLDALNGTSQNKVGQVLRGAMRSALTRQYDANRAVTRIGAISGGNYRIRVLDESEEKLSVSYSKGLQGRGEWEEQVEVIPLAALKAVVEAIHASDKESLRPLTLAQLSTRVLWNLLHYSTAAGGIEDAYRDLFPSLDWSFLRRRQQQLSEKALENLRQEREARGETDVAEMERAEEAIASVEHAMAQVHEVDAQRRRSRAAEAALARQLGSSSHAATDEWELETPSEPDRDELLACCSEYMDESDVIEAIDQLMDLNIRNWRQLANETPENLSEKLQRPVEVVEPWLDRAQQESVDEIMVEMCDGQAEAVKLLIARANSGTPKDLAAWRAIPQMLLETIQQHTSDDGDNAISLPTVDQLGKWTCRAHRLLQAHEWINWYATPVS